MKTFPRVVVSSALALALAAGVAFAQDHHDDQDHHDNQHYVHHDDWRKGNRINHEDWNRGSQVDWHSHHLRRPPRGYEWREVDGNYVLANNDGVIFSVVVAPH